VITLLGRVFHVGEQPGLGQTLKLANNLMSQAAIAITGRGARPGRQGRSRSTIDARRDQCLEWPQHGVGRQVPEACADRGFDFGFTTGLALKDVRMCLDEAALLGVPMSVGRSVGELLSRTQEEFGAESDCTCVARVVESRAGCEISPKRGSKS
jgi:3-hydroxyisobutyrate dehydrogenase-like beta-hydroxyacid dehydrogenase